MEQGGRQELRSDTSSHGILSKAHLLDRGWVFHGSVGLGVN